jgi:uncharacterized protein (DUF2249 family)
VATTTTARSANQAADSAPATTSLSVASTQADAAAVESVEAHHAALAGTLSALVEALLVAAGSSHREAVEDARIRLVQFCTGELLPHAAAEEGTLYPAAAADPRARLLVEAMIGEHRVLEGLVAALGRADVEPARLAGFADALRVLFDSHLVKENELILPLVAADPAVSLSGILAGMRELLGGSEHEHDAADSQETSGGCGCGCSCGESNAGTAIVLDVRNVPHAIRHATVFGAMDAVPTGASLVLVAPHDPLPLLAQLDHREPDTFSVQYQERGPEAWRLRITRVT